VGGTQSYEQVAEFDAQQNRFVTLPLDLGPAEEQVYPVLFGTGIRHRSSLSAVKALFEVCLWKSRLLPCLAVIDRSARAELCAPVAQKLRL